MSFTADSYPLTCITFKLHANITDADSVNYTSYRLNVLSFLLSPGQLSLYSWFGCVHQS